MDVNDFFLQVSKGAIRGHSSIDKFGINEDVDTGTTPEDVWGGGGTYSYYPTSEESVQISSDSASDAAAGIGARTVQVQGLDANWAVATEVVTLDGTNTVDLETDFIRVFRMIVTSAGSSNTNAGTITLQGSTDTAAVILAGQGQTQQAIYTVPGGHTGYLHKWYAGLSKTGPAREAQFTYQVRAFGQIYVVKGDLVASNVGSTLVERKFQCPVVIPEKSDIKVVCESVSANDTGVFAGFDIVLKED